MMLTVTATTELEKYRTVVKTKNQLFVVDEPIEVGGKDLGPTPGQLFAASLATCTSITIKLYADRKGWAVDQIVIDVTYERNIKEKKSFITKKIEIIGDLDEDQKQKLFEIGSKCPIHATMQNPIEIQSQLIN